MSTSFAALIALAAVATTYFTCIRPMRRGHRATGGSNTDEAELDQQIAGLRKELRVLRAQDTPER
jgi:hypothetical protein